MKTKRFIIEYANYQMSEVEKLDISEDEKLQRTRNITRAVHFCEIGAMTIDETMQQIIYARSADF